MSAVAIYGEVVSRRIEACEHEVEEWKVAYEEAQRCRHFERWLARAVELFRVIRELDETWRANVFRGVEPFKPEDYQNMTDLYTRWLGLYDLMAPKLQHYEEQYRDGVEGAEEYRQCCAEAREILATSEPPTLSKAIGLREQSISHQASSKIREMLDRARQQPKRPPEAVETVDASFLRS